MKTKLTIEQSQTLIELGVDPKLASQSEIYDEPCHRSYMAVFTLADLLSILPKEIGNYELNINSTESEHFVSYILWDFMGNCTYIRDYLSDNQFSAPELIDALNQLAIWCLENHYINTKEK